MTPHGASHHEYGAGVSGCLQGLPEGRQHFPGIGEHGAEGRRTAAAAIASVIGDEEVDADLIVYGGDVVVVRGSEESLVKSSGRKYNMRFVHWLTYDASGRISNMREYNDTAEMAEAFDHEA